MIVAAGGMDSTRKSRCRSLTRNGWHSRARCRGCRAGDGTLRPGRCRVQANLHESPDRIGDEIFALAPWRITSAPRKYWPWRLSTTTPEIPALPVFAGTAARGCRLLLRDEPAAGSERRESAAVNLECSDQFGDHFSGGASNMRLLLYPTDFRQQMRADDCIMNCRGRLANLRRRAHLHRPRGFAAVAYLRILCRCEPPIS